MRILSVVLFLQLLPPTLPANHVAPILDGPFVPGVGLTCADKTRQVRTYPGAFTPVIPYETTTHFGGVYLWLSTDTYHYTIHFPDAEYDVAAWCVPIVCAEGPCH